MTAPREAAQAYLHNLAATGDPSDPMTALAQAQVARQTPQTGPGSGTATRMLPLLRAALDKVTVRHGKLVAKREELQRGGPGEARVAVEKAARNEGLMATAMERIRAEMGFWVAGEGVASSAAVPVGGAPALSRASASAGARLNGAGRVAQQLAAARQEPPSPVREAPACAVEPVRKDTVAGSSTFPLQKGLSSVSASTPAPASTPASSHTASAGAMVHGAGMVENAQQRAASARKQEPPSPVRETLACAVEPVRRDAVAASLTSSLQKGLSSVPASTPDSTASTKPSPAKLPAPVPFIPADHRIRAQNKTLDITEQRAFDACDEMLREMQTIAGFSSNRHDPWGVIAASRLARQDLEDNPETSRYSYDKRARGGLLWHLGLMKDRAFENKHNLVARHSTRKSDTSRTSQEREEFSRHFDQLEGMRRALENEIDAWDPTHRETWDRRPMIMSFFPFVDGYEPSHIQPFVSRLSTSNWILTDATRSGVVHLFGLERKIDDIQQQINLNLDRTRVDKRDYNLNLRTLIDGAADEAAALKAYLQCMTPTSSETVSRWHELREISSMEKLLKHQWDIVQAELVQLGVALPTNESRSASKIALRRDQVGSLRKIIIKEQRQLTRAREDLEFYTRDGHRSATIQRISESHREVYTLDKLVGRLENELRMLGAVKENNWRLPPGFVPPPTVTTKFTTPEHPLTPGQPVASPTKPPQPSKGIVALASASTSSSTATLTSTSTSTSTVTSYASTSTSTSSATTSTSSAMPPMTSLTAAVNVPRNSAPMSSSATAPIPPPPGHKSVIVRVVPPPGARPRRIVVAEDTGESYEQDSDWGSDDDESASAPAPRVQPPAVVSDTPATFVPGFGGTVRSLPPAAPATRRLTSGRMEYAKDGSLIPESSPLLTGAHLAASHVSSPPIRSSPTPAPRYVAGLPSPASSSPAIGSSSPSPALSSVSSRFLSTPTSVTSPALRRHREEMTPSTSSTSLGDFDRGAEALGLLRAEAAAARKMRQAMSTPPSRSSFTLASSSTSIDRARASMASSSSRGGGSSSGSRPLSGSRTTPSSSSGSNFAERLLEKKRLRDKSAADRLLQQQLRKPIAAAKRRAQALLTPAATPQPKKHRPGAMANLAAITGESAYRRQVPSNSLLNGPDKRARSLLNPLADKSKSKPKPVSNPLKNNKLDDDFESWWAQTKADREADGNPIIDLD